MQLSSCAMYAATVDPSPSSDFTARVRILQPVNGPEAGTDYEVQFNLISMKHWYQFVFMSYQGKFNWVPPTIVPCSVNSNYTSQSYVVQAAAEPFVSLNLIPNVTLPQVQDGRVYLVLQNRGGLLTMSVQDVNSGTVYWSASWDESADIPVGMTIVLVSSQPDQTWHFTTAMAEADVTFAAPVQLHFWSDSYDQFPYNGEFGPWGTYNGLPLWWDNNTGEGSNIWTNLISQTPKQVGLQLSLVEGNQTPNNPPVGLIGTVLTLRKE